MYQFSLSSFIHLFKLTLATKQSAKTTEERLELLCADLEIRVLYFVGTAIFKVDRPMFALHLVHGMHSNYFLPKEWEIFTGSLVASVSEGAPKGFPSWAPSERQSAYRLLSEHLPHLVHSLELENSGKWQRFASSLEAERDFPPLKGVSAFQRVLIVQAFRPDRLQSAILHFCCDILRIDSVSPPPLSLAALYADSQPLTPLLLLSSPGADPSKELQEFAAKTIGAGQYEELAMGGGQQELALQMLRSAAMNGGWVCLKNLHLVVAWLPVLEKALSSIEPNPEFRLWLTSEPHPLFPSILLQESLKATFESPPGVKKNLQRAFDSWGPEIFSDASNSIQARLLFLLACFHAVIQERRTFIPQGWSKFYEFSYGDMRAGTFVIKAVSAHASGKSRESGIDWKAIYGLMEDAIYGGRIDNVYDMRVLRTHLSIFFSEKLVIDSGAGSEVISGTPLRMPMAADFESFKKTISQLPDIDPPYIFGLPDNIERSLQRSTSAAVIRQLRALSASDAEANKFDREKWRIQLGPIIEQWQQMVQAAPGLLRKKTDVGHHDSKSSRDPLDDFVSMENDMAGDMCTLIDGMLNALKKVLFGSGLLTPAIQQIAASLLAGAVPSEWNSRWEGPEKPQSWLRELVRKRMSLSKWRSASSRGGLLNDPVALGDLFNPATFINALRQQTARMLNVAIDKVKMVCSWDNKKDRMGGCPLPCTLSSLLLQGASFEKGMLRESASDASELTPAPNVTIGFVEKSTADEVSVRSVIPIPVYFTPTREEFLMELDMPTDGGDDAKWVLAGVALFLNEDD